MLRTLGHSRTDDPEQVARIVDRIATIYLIAGLGTDQAAAVASLLTFDRQGETKTVAGYPDLGPSDEECTEQIEVSVARTTAEAFLDLVYIDSETAAVLVELEYKSWMFPEGRITPNPQMLP